jgi:hypothetical protein
MKARSRFSSTPTKPSNDRPRQAGVKERWTRVGVLRELQGLADPRVWEKMSYFGLSVPDHSRNFRSGLECASAAHRQRS